jgi:hypothetical protein
MRAGEILSLMFMKFRSKLTTRYDTEYRALIYIVLLVAGGLVGFWGAGSKNVYHYVGHFRRAAG